MKARLTLLRILVLVGCLPLVVRQAGVVTVGATSQTCTNFGSKTTPNCPSGCTSGTYITYPLLGGKGFYDATQVTSPCSPSTCAQPTAYNHAQPMRPTTLLPRQLNETLLVYRVWQRGPVLRPFQVH